MLPSIIENYFFIPVVLSFLYFFLYRIFCLKSREKNKDSMFMYKLDKITYDFFLGIAFVATWYCWFLYYINSNF
jgi:hypothetical protein